MGRAFSPLRVISTIPGALPQAGMEMRRWRAGKSFEDIMFSRFDSSAVLMLGGRVYP